MKKAGTEQYDNNEIDNYLREQHMKNIALASLLLFAACSCDKESTLSSTPVVTAAKDKWEFYKDWLGYWRWRQTAPNGRIVGASSEGYNNKQDAVDNAKREGYTE